MAKGKHGRAQMGGVSQSGLMAQVQQMQAKLAQAQEEIAAATVEGSAGGGAVRVRMTGSMICEEVLIAPVLIQDGDIEMLQDLVTAGVNQAIQQAQALTEAKMGPLTGGLGSMMGLSG
ncbi:MAG: YbaB/EbfC family nucleoid-associated protein [Anaerolineales bacterium]|nr:YbaB/EbfC family nucleoid-associated protein [Anaerolineales bacterium]